MNVKYKDIYNIIRIFFLILFKKYNLRYQEKLNLNLEKEFLVYFFIFLVQVFILTVIFFIFIYTDFFINYFQVFLNFMIGLFLLKKFIDFFLLILI